MIDNSNILYNSKSEVYLNLKYTPADYMYKNFNKQKYTTPVEVSDELYDYLTYKSSHTQDDLISTDRFKPKQLKLNLADIEITDKYKHLINKYTPMTNDTDNLDTTGLYIGMSSRILPVISNVELPTGKLTTIDDVSDNATQVLQYLQKALDTYIASNSTKKDLFTTGKKLASNIKHHTINKHILLFNRIENMHNPNMTNNWRWHGKHYIGIQSPKTEYLDADKNIDYILEWKLIPVIV